MVVTAPGPDWLALQQRMDQIVDLVWAEPVEFHPWTGGSVDAPGTADTTRPVIITQGTYVTPGAHVVGEVASGAAGNATQLEQTVWASVQEQYLDIYMTTWKANDRVYWPDRLQWFQLSYIAPSATLRPNVHMTPLNESVLQASGNLASSRFAGRDVMRLKQSRTRRRSSYKVSFTLTKAPKASS